MDATAAASTEQDVDAQKPASGTAKAHVRFDAPSGEAEGGGDGSQAAAAHKRHRSKHRRRKTHLVRVPRRLLKAATSLRSTVRQHCSMCGCQTCSLQYSTVLHVLTHSLYCLSHS